MFLDYSLGSAMTQKINKLKNKDYLDLTFLTTIPPETVESMELASSSRGKTHPTIYCVKIFFYPNYLRSGRSSLHWIISLYFFNTTENGMCVSRAGSEPPFADDQRYYQMI